MKKITLFGCAVSMCSLLIAADHKDKAKEHLVDAKDNVAAAAHHAKEHVQDRVEDARDAAKYQAQKAKETIKENIHDAATTVAEKTRNLTETVSLVPANDHEAIIDIRETPYNTVMLTTMVRDLEKGHEHVMTNASVSYENGVLTIIADKHSY